MQFKMLSFLTPLILAIVFLGGCAKTNYDGSTRVKPLSNPEPAPTAQQRGQPAPAPGSTPTAPAGNLPVVSFVQSEVEMDSKLEARLDLQLSEVSSLPVTVVVDLVDATARHYRDFAGFKTRSSETSQTIVIAPGTTRMPLPVIGGRRTRFCDSYFNAVINSARLQNAKVVSNSAKINLPCENVAPAIDQPTPPPPVLEPILEPIVQPRQPPVQPCQVIARFESEVVDNKEHAKRTSVKIVIDQDLEWPVIIDLETRDGSAYAGIDYVRVKVQLTIPAGQRSVEVPIELLKNDRCRTSDMHRWQKHAHFEFNAVVTGITGANMLKPSALIILEKDVDDEKCLAAPTVSN